MALLLSQWMDSARLTVQALMRTYSCETAAVREAEEFLNGRMGDTGFAMELLEIIGDGGGTFSVRAAACVILREAVKKHWHIDMDCELKVRFVERYFALLQCCESLVGLLSHTTRVFVELWAYSKELEMLLGLADNGFDEHVTASLVVTEAYVHTVKTQLGDDAVAYGRSQVPHVLEALVGSTQVCVRALCFRVLYWLVKYGFVELPLSVTGTCFGYVQLLNNSPEDMAFTKVALKLYGHLLRRQAGNVDPENAMSLLKVFVWMVEQDLPVCLRPYQCNALHALMEHPTIRSAIASAIPALCQKVILPFFRLTSEDVEDSAHDVKSFLASFHAQMLDYCDYRGCICTVISGSPFAEDIGNYFASMLAAGLSDDLAYSVLHILSSCPNNSFERDVVLLRSPSHLVRSGALLCIKHLPCDAYPVDFYTEIIRLLGDQSLLVRYLAMTALDTMWQMETRRDQTIQICLPFVHLILEQYAHLAAEFSDFDSVHFIANFLSFFSASLIDIAPDLIVKVFAMYIHFVGCSEDPTACGVIITELFLFIRTCLESNADIAPSLNATVLMVLKHLPNLPNSVRGTLLILVSNIVCMAPSALPAYEPLLGSIPSLIQTSSTDEVSEALLTLLRSLILRFPDTVDCASLLAFAVETSQALIRAGDRFGSLYASFLLIAALLDVRPPPDPHALFAALVPMITPFVDLQDSWESLAALLLSMFSRGFQPTPELYSAFIDMSSSAQLRALAELSGQQAPLAAAIAEKQRNEEEFPDVEEGAAVIPVMTCSSRRTPRHPSGTAPASAGA